MCEGPSPPLLRGLSVQDGWRQVKKLITPQQDKDHNDVGVSGEKVLKTKWGVVGVCVWGGLLDSPGNPMSWLEARDGL